LTYCGCYCDQAFKNIVIDPNFVLNGFTKEVKELEGGEEVSGKLYFDVLLILIDLQEKIIPFWYMCSSIPFEYIIIALCYCCDDVGN